MCALPGHATERENPGRHAHLARARRHQLVRLAELPYLQPLFDETPPTVDKYTAPARFAEHDPVSVKQKGKDGLQCAPGRTLDRGTRSAASRRERIDGLSRSYGLFSRMENSVGIFIKRDNPALGKALLCDQVLAVHVRITIYLTDCNRL